MERIREVLGQQIRAARINAGFSIRALAEKSGIDPSHIVRIEAGRYNVGVDTIAKLGNALGLQLRLI